MKKILKNEYFGVLLIFSFAFLIRIFLIWPANTILGFDQARDLFDSLKIIGGDLKVIGPTAGNNSDLHHGVAWLYFLTPAVIVSKNPAVIAIWNSLFNAGSVIVLYFLSKSLFRSMRAGIIAAILAAVSYYFVSYSGWLSNPTVTLLTVPLFFLGLAKHKEDKKWGLPLSGLFLGLTIQFELFFLYLIPTTLIIWVVSKFKLPDIKILAVSIIGLTLSLSTMIATEIKYNFSGVKSLLGAGKLVGGLRPNYNEQFINRFFETFSQTLIPSIPKVGVIIGLIIICYLIYKKQWFTLIYLFSPALMLILGYHNAPWFLIGLPSVIVLSASFLLSKIKSNFLLIAILLPIVFLNLLTIKNENKIGQQLLEPDKSAILSTQIEVMEYTYQKANGEPFAIDTVTNPLYINVVWGWNYNWYSRQYNYKPTWLGGDQIPPYNTLETATGKEKYLFLIIDTTPRIPYSITLSSIESMQKRGELIEEKEFDGIKVITFKKNIK